MCNPYNGYKNYETWNVSLWIDNEQGDYDYVSENATDIYQNCDKDKHDFCNEFSTWLKDYIEEQNPLAEQASMFSDILQAALDNVNWYDLAENWFEVCQENDPDDTETEEE